MKVGKAAVGGALRARTGEPVFAKGFDEASSWTVEQEKEKEGAGDWGKSKKVRRWESEKVRKWEGGKVAVGETNLTFKV